MQHRISKTCVKRLSNKTTTGSVAYRIKIDSMNHNDPFRIFKASNEAGTKFWKIEKWVNRNKGTSLTTLSESGQPPVSKSKQDIEMKLTIIIGSSFKYRVARNTKARKECL